MRALLVLLLLAAPPREKGIVLERTVKLYLRDPLDRLREVQRKERVTFQDGKLKIEDLTFGEVLLIRPDKKIVWRVDPFAGTYSEHTFEQLVARRKEVLDEIAECRDRVKGSRQEEELSVLLQGYNVFAAVPKLEVKDLGRSEKALDRDAPGRAIVANENTYLLYVFVDSRLADATGIYETLGQIGAFHPKVAEKMKELGGFPVKGTIRYVSYLDRVTEAVEVTSVARADLAEDAFEPPIKNLKRIALKGFDALDEKKVEKPKNFDKGFREDEIDRENRGEKKDEKPK